MPKPEHCPCCGQIILDRIVLELTPIQRRIWEIVSRRRELPTMRLRELTWADDPDGGPDSHNLLSMHVGNINKKLKPHGMMIYGTRGPGDNVYRIVELAAS